MRRVRSTTVVLGGVGLLAATLTACSSEPDRRCIDPVTYKELPDYECGGGDGDSDGSSSSHSHSGRYYYGGSSSNGKVSGGSFDKSAVSSGGFGGHGSSSGG
ncbi:hypothetical protein KV205_28510 [Streptomyces sp. SKN60]|uniref:hypothetical protein n=1 Tax=Streptomyces sp. SKN60 TaxID=2855506 RepID=UPI002247C062|nr:hypothetical protein [Streptomyces sp. SKN60]MCX2184445.1 hypothetical protein [Streptomyces sp. SKN60]